MRLATAAVTLIALLSLALSSDRSGARGAGASMGRMLTDEDAAARVVRSPWEPAPGNRAANARVPTRSEIARFRRQSGRGLRYRVTGGFAGTTDEILQWAAHKWGLDADLLRAVAVTESYWNQAFVGDAGTSYGLMQIKYTVAPGTRPLSAQSTAFNVDYYCYVLRTYLEGRAGWLDDQPGRVGRYRRGDLYGSVGAWYSGNWRTPSAERYIARVRANLRERTWQTEAFAAASR